MAEDWERRCDGKATHCEPACLPESQRTETVDIEGSSGGLSNTYTPFLKPKRTEKFSHKS